MQVIRLLKYLSYFLYLLLDSNCSKFKTTNEIEQTFYFNTEQNNTFVSYSSLR